MFFFSIDVWWKLNISLDVTCRGQKQSKTIYYFYLGPGSQKSSISISTN